MQNCSRSVPSTSSPARNESYALGVVLQNAGDSAFATSTRIPSAYTNFPAANMMSRASNAKWNTMLPTSRMYPRSDESSMVSGTRPSPSLRRTRQPRNAPCTRSAACSGDSDVRYDAWCGIRPRFRGVRGGGVRSCLTSSIDRGVTHPTSETNSNTYTAVNHQLENTSNSWSLS